MYVKLFFTHGRETRGMLLDGRVERKWGRHFCFPGKCQCFVTIEKKKDIFVGKTEGGIYIFI